MFIIMYLNYVSPRRGIRFVFDPVSDQIWYAPTKASEQMFDANLCCDHDNWRKIAWIAPKFACRLSFTQGSDKFENQFGRTSTFKMAADLKKMACAIFFKMP